MQILNVVIVFVSVAMMNIMRFPGRKFAVTIRKYNTVNKAICGIVPAFVLEISDTVETLMSFVDNFNDGRRSQIAFEDVNAVTFKIVVGVLAQDGKRGDDFRRKFHDNQSFLDESRGD